MERYNEEELLYLIHCGSEEARHCLYQQYYIYAKRWIRPYCYGYQGMEFDDYVQVAMMSFQSVLDSYRNDLDTSLRTFMRIALIRRFISKLKQTKDTKIFHENAIISLDDYFGESQGMRYEEVIGDPLEKNYPEVVLRVKEQEAYYDVNLFQKVSPRERAVLMYKQMGYDEIEIAEKLNISVKSVYNAAYRYHKKTQVIDEKGEM